MYNFYVQNFNCLLSLLEKWKNAVDKKKVIGALLSTDRLKAFDCVSHELIVIKLNVYGFMVYHLPP